MPFLFAFADGGLGFEFCVFVVGWRHAFRSEGPFNINVSLLLVPSLYPLPPAARRASKLGGVSNHEHLTAEERTNGHRFQ